MKEVGWVEKFNSPSTAAYPSELKDPQGFWATSNLYFMTEGINTQMVSKADAPKTYEDLLDPRWKGKMGWSTSSGSGGPTFVGNILQTMGQEKGMAYLEQLSRQDVKNLNLSARAVLDQVIAGEYPISLMIFNHHTVISAQQGAPSDWIPLQPCRRCCKSPAWRSSRRTPTPRCSSSTTSSRRRASASCKKSTTCRRIPAYLAKTPASSPRSAASRSNVMSPDDLLKNDKEWDDIYHRLFLASSPPGGNGTRAVFGAPFPPGSGSRGGTSQARRSVPLTAGGDSSAYRPRHASGQPTAGKRAATTREARLPCTPREVGQR